MFQEMRCSWSLHGLVPKVGPYRRALWLILRILLITLPPTCCRPSCSGWSQRQTAWAPLAAEQEVRLTVRPGPGAHVWTAPGALKQVLDNLLAARLDPLHLLRTSAARFLRLPP
jgi:hypothetical protein